MVKSASAKVETGINLISVSVIDSVINDLKHLKLDQFSYQSIAGLLEAKKEQYAPKKRELADEHQCRHVNADTRCGAPMCDKKLQRCWMHMSLKQQTKYQANKNKNKN